jgi:hypothetical protein
MEKRALKGTGFPDTDRELLQNAFDQEFAVELEEIKKRRKYEAPSQCVVADKSRSLSDVCVNRENRRRAARQAGLQRRRQLMESLLQEEQEELANSTEMELTIRNVRGCVL